MYPPHCKWFSFIITDEVIDWNYLIPFVLALKNMATAEKYAALPLKTLSLMIRGFSLSNESI